MPRPAIVIQHYPPFIAGAERQAQLLARLLSAHTIGAEVVTTKFRSDLPSREREGLVLIRRLATGFKGNLRLALNFVVGFLFFAVYGHRYAVVHGHCLSPFVLGALAGAKLRRCKFLLKICAIGTKGEIERLKQYRYGKLFWSLTKQADLFIVETQAGASELASAGLPPGRICVIPGAVDPNIAVKASDNARMNARRLLGLPDEPVVLFVGRLVAEKGLDLLLSAWREVIRKTAATLAVVGDGPEMGRIVAMTSSETWKDSLHLFGWRSDPETFYRAADIFVFPSQSEAFGNVLAEAMVHGLPIVSTRVGLACEWMRDGESALLISGESPGELANAILQLIENKTLRQRLGQEAEQLAIRHFTSNSYIANHLDLYKRFSTSSDNQV